MSIFPITVLFTVIVQIETGRNRHMIVCLFLRHTYRPFGHVCRNSRSNRTSQNRTRIRVNRIGYVGGEDTPLYLLDTLSWCPIHARYLLISTDRQPADLAYRRVYLGLPRGITMITFKGSLRRHFGTPSKTRGPKKQLVVTFLLLGLLWPLFVFSARSAYCVACGSVVLLKH